MFFALDHHRIVNLDHVTQVTIEGKDLIFFFGFDGDNIVVTFPSDVFAKDTFDRLPQLRLRP